MQYQSNEKENTVKEVDLFISLQNVSNDSFPESDKATNRSLPWVYQTEGRERELNKFNLLKYQKQLVSFKTTNIL